VILCSDGLHGPVSDQEIKEILATETDLKKAGEGLLQKALERDGPDNITVVLARFDGDGLMAPGPNETVGFVAYDPGRDPVSATAETPGPSGDTSGSTPLAEGSSAAAAAIRRAAGTRNTTVVQTVSAAHAAVSNDKPGREGRSVVVLFFLALLAVAIGGVSVLKCERDQALGGESAGHTP
jgi:hypothetical protein